MAQGNAGGPAKAVDWRAVELAKCGADPAYFCHAYGQIDDAQEAGDGTGVMPFKLWPEQVRVLWLFLIHRLLIILKARQLGISWLCCIYALWMCLFNPGKVVLCFSKGKDEANELIRRILVLYERLPDWMTAALPRLRKKNTAFLSWANGSRVRSLPATRGAGRSFTASLVIMDEAAHLMWARQIYSALKPTIDGGGQLIVLSSANGLGNLFHQLWTRAVAGVNNFTTIFLPWWARPGRTLAWLEAQKREYTDPEIVKQEYPESAQQAFIASGRSRFASEWIEAQTENTNVEPIALKDLPEGLRTINARPGGYLRVYKLPVPTRKYVLGADVAEGLAHGDYSCAVVIDAETWEEIAELHGHWEPDDFAKMIKQLGELYDARIAPERNNHGHAVLLALKRDGARKVIEGHDGKPGWHSNTATKPLIIDSLASALKDRACTIRSVAALDEMQIYRIKDNGSTGAPELYFDDRVIMWAIAVHIAKTPAKLDTKVVPLTPAQRLFSIGRNE